MEKSTIRKVKIHSEEWFEENCEHHFIGSYEAYYSKEHDSSVSCECVSLYAGKTINVCDDDGEMVVCDNTYNYIEDWMIESVISESDGCKWCNIQLLYLEEGYYYPVEHEQNYCIHCGRKLNNE